MTLFLLSCIEGSDKTPVGSDTSDTDSATTRDTEDTTDSAPPPDADGDGYNETADCDDTNAEVYPDAAEVCNGTDDNCDGATDEGALHPDADGDSYGDAASAGTVCETDGWVADDEDCDDAEATIHPGATEACGWEDTNCDGERPCDVDEEALWAFQEQDLGAEHVDGVSTSLSDVDGDGLADVLLGGAGGQFTDPWSELSEGQVHIVLSDPARGRSTLDLSMESTWTLVGDDGDALGGSDTSFIPDRDGDGLPELFASALGGERAWLLTGASLLMAPPFATLSSVADQELTDPGSTRGSTGKSLAEAGDMDGDGTPDLAVGTYAGVWVVPFDLSTADLDLSDGAFIAGAETTFGDRVERVGDVDGDGLDELLVGDYLDETGGSDTGQVYLFLGGTLAWGATTQAEDADMKIHGQPETFLGYAIEAGGDLDGDGRDDWVVGATGEHAEDGAAWFVYDTAEHLGSTLDTGDLLVAIRGVSPGNFSFGDFDGDHAPDLAIRAAWTLVPEVFVLRNASLPRTGVTDVADSALIHTGRGLSGTARMDGDVNGDGCDDLLVTDPLWPNRGWDQGAGWVIAGWPE